MAILRGEDVLGFDVAVDDSLGDVPLDPDRLRGGLEALLVLQGDERRVERNWLREKIANGPIVEEQSLTLWRVSAGLSRESADGPGFSEALRSEAGCRLQARTL